MRSTRVICMPENDGSRQHSTAQRRGTAARISSSRSSYAAALAVVSPSSDSHHFLSTGSCCSAGATVCPCRVCIALHCCCTAVPPLNTPRLLGAGGVPVCPGAKVQGAGHWGRHHQGLRLRGECAVVGGIFIHSYLVASHKHKGRGGREGGKARSTIKGCGCAVTIVTFVLYHPPVWGLHWGRVSCQVLWCCCCQGGWCC